MKPLSCFKLLLCLLLSGCASEEESLIGHWRATNVDNCKTRCSFHILQYHNRKAGYHVVFNGPYGKRASGQIVHQGKNEYVIRAPIGEIPLTLKNGELHHPRGRIFSRATPLSERPASTNE